MYINLNIIFHVNENSNVLSICRNNNKNCLPCDF